ncbi:hypothetical protein [Psychroflexus halocasei]|uniref:Lipoprotein n=1 Tax=Psychroflexus halocasei TaxID=908615 RepID=A0A1H3ZZ58_9FLAO|nr:hypothetical protein [Psychroflexus halocasei]SEA28562.1 hypothetical protein SAMN05421540_104249 [Psychroflexus halocasei]
MKLKTLILFALIFALQACVTDDQCIDYTIDLTSLEEEYNCENTKNQLDINLSDENIIINNQDDYNELVSGNCQPEIDFNKYDLVIGKKNLSNGNDSIHYELIKNCTNGNLHLKVFFYQNDTSVAPSLTYHALIPKMSDQQILNIEIIIVD